VLLTFTLLTAAILALWGRGGDRDAPVRRFAWLALYCGAVVSALAAGIVRPVGLLWIALFAFAVRTSARAAPGSLLRALATTAIVVLAAGLMAHQWPGFNNPRVLSDLRLTPDALPYRLHLNFDKTAVGLFVLALLHPLLASAADARALLRSVWLPMLVTIATLLGLALASGYVRFAPKFPSEAWLFLWANLCLTCVAEEAFFRGFIQARLAARWRARRHGPWLALGVAAVLFGLAHAAGGVTYVILSTLAGIGYGWAYRRAGQRIEASILTHFAVNALHFVGFTYPALARS
jgi:membrane protease YdiL (CAAX protease family)